MLSIIRKYNFEPLANNYNLFFVDFKDENYNSIP